MGPLSNSNEKYLKNANPFWTDNLKHSNYDEFWQRRALAPHMKNVKPAVMFVGGWFDAEDLAGPLKLFRAIEKNGAVSPETLVMGPWPHGGWSRGPGDKLGNLDFASKTGEYFRENIELPFFLDHLKGKGNGLKAKSDATPPKAWLFETGTKQWRRFDAWPPKNATARVMHFDAAGKTFYDRAGHGRLRRISERSRSACAGDRRNRCGNAGQLYDVRSAICLPAAGRFGLPNRAAGS